MTMQTFDFPYHTCEDKYPESSTTVQFGGGYTFVSAPNAPDQREFMLNFPAMKYYFSSGTTLSNSIEPALNLLRLREFYEAHRLYEKFIYVHPVLGSLIVRFAKPLHIPKGEKGGYAVYRDINIILREQP